MLRWGVPTGDLFASSLNKKLPVFFSLERETESLGTDALSFPWNFTLAYAFPPFPLLPLVVWKIVQDQAEVILMPLGGPGGVGSPR